MGKSYIKAALFAFMSLVIASCSIVNAQDVKNNSEVFDRLFETSADSLIALGKVGALRKVAYT